MTGGLEAKAKALEREESQDSQSSSPLVPLGERLPLPSEHLEFHDLHQLAVRRKALRALVRAQRENQLPEIVNNAR